MREDMSVLERRRWAREENRKKRRADLESLEIQERIREVHSALDVWIRAKTFGLGHNETVEILEKTEERLIAAAENAKPISRLEGSH